MDTATTAGAGAMLTTPLWLHTLNPYLQFVGMTLGISWVLMQMYYKLKNERKKSKHGS